MAGSDVQRPAGVRLGDLAPRIVVGVALIVLALAADWAGGWAFNALVTVATMLAFGEWCAMHGCGGGTRATGLAALAAVALLAGLAFPVVALVLIAVTAAVLVAVDRLGAGGVLYAGLPAVALIWLRQLPQGAELVIWTLAMVWATDICAYFAGRLIGGPRIAPAISPSKTWAGLAGGMIGAGATAAVLADALGLQPGKALAALAGALLAIVAQVGDFFESHLKRRAGVKDSSNLLPGHGGVMDRLDGVIPVVVIVALWQWVAA
jgi:phosphatidate cytidylyltransferase